MPLFSTKMMPVRAARSSTRGLPPLGLGGSFGKSGSIISQSSSLTNSLAILLIYPDTAVLKEFLSGVRNAARAVEHHPRRAPDREPPGPLESQIELEQVLEQEAAHKRLSERRLEVVHDG